MSPTTTTRSPTTSTTGSSDSDSDGDSDGDSESDGDSSESGDDDDDDAENSAMAMFKTEDVEKEQLDVATVGAEKEYDLVLALSQSSWMSLWAILGMFCVVNTFLFLCCFKKKGYYSRNNDDLFDESQNV